VFNCARCDYDLTATATQGQPTICPECGLHQVVERSATERPSFWMLALMLTWPTIGLCTLCALLVLAAFWEVIAPACAIVLLVAMLAAFLSGWIVPFDVGRRVAAAAEPPGRRRRRLSARVVWLGLLLNLGIGAGYWWLGLFLVARVADSHIGDFGDVMD
jgi:hypothetical protein